MNPREKRPSGTIDRNDWCHRGAFTLIHCWWSVAIITILAAMLPVVLAKAKERAKRISYLNNLKQAGLALRMYTEVNKDWLPVYQGYTPWPWDMEITV